MKMSKRVVLSLSAMLAVGSVACAAGDISSEDMGDPNQPGVATLDVDEGEDEAEVQLGEQTKALGAITYVSHTSLGPIVTNNNFGNMDWLYQYSKKFQPALHVRDAGCVPFPAVGEYRASAGLRNTGASNGGCGSSIGQVYTRYKTVRLSNGQMAHAMMYEYYFPKDQGAATGTGHRHDWEEVIVFVTTDWSRVIAASYSGHGDYWKVWNPPTVAGTHVRVHYYREYLFDTHRMGADFGGTASYFSHPLANWYQLSEGVRHTLNNAAWMNVDGKQKAEPKIKDSKFDEYIGKAIP
jgi:Necrosis inducing protein (NPP1)